MIYAYGAINSLYDPNIPDTNGAPSYLWASLLIGLISTIVIIGIVASRIGYNLVRNKIMAKWEEFRQKTSEIEGVDDVINKLEYFSKNITNPDFDFKTELGDLVEKVQKVDYNKIVPDNLLDPEALKRGFINNQNYLRETSSSSVQSPLSSSPRYQSPILPRESSSPRYQSSSPVYQSLPRESSSPVYQSLPRESSSPRYQPSLPAYQPPLREPIPPRPTYQSPLGQSPLVRESTRPAYQSSPRYEPPLPTSSDNLSNNFYTEEPFDVTSFPTTLPTINTSEF